MEDDKKTIEEKEDQRDMASRRKFLLAFGWGGLLSAIAVSVLGAVRAMVPDVLYEPPTLFKAEKPEDYPEGIVKFIPEEKVFVDHDAKGIFAMSAKCTHLGCVIDWVEDQNGYLCPCHGAKFLRDGKNDAGPAPKPLPRFQVTLAKDGRLLIDKGITVDKEYRLKV